MIHVYRRYIFWFHYTEKRLKKEPEKSCEIYSPSARFNINTHLTLNAKFVINKNITTTPYILFSELRDDIFITHNSFAPQYPDMSTDFANTKSVRNSLSLPYRMSSLRLFYGCRDP